MDPRALVVVAAIAGAALLQGRVGEANAERRANDFRYTPDPSVMKVVAGAHRSTMADLLWLRALPDMARPLADKAMKRRWITGAAEAITDLEPTFGTVYWYAAAHLVLDREDRNVAAAIALLEKGVRHNPESAGMHVKLTMEYFEHRKDRDKAIEHLEIASKLPGCDSLTLAMLASLKVKDHADLVAIAVWADALEGTPPGRSRAVVEYELWRTKRLIAERAAKEFEARHRAPPGKPSDLAEPGLVDPVALPMVLDGLQIDAKGLPRYERLDELDRQCRILRSDEECSRFRDENSRWPSEDEWKAFTGPLPAPPAGRRWRYADGKLTLASE